MINGFVSISSLCSLKPHNLVKKKKKNGLRMSDVIKTTESYEYNPFTIINERLN